MATYYIATTGNDTTGNGSSGNPWATISKAHTSASSGDTIICKDGTYTWVSQTFTKSLTIQAQNNGLAIFDGAAASVNWTVNTIITLSIVGIVFQNSILSVADNGFFQAGGNTSVLTISNCTFKPSLKLPASSAYANYFYANSYSFALTLTNCLFEDLHSTGGAAANGGLIGTQNSAVVTVTLTNCVLGLLTATALLQLIAAIGTGSVTLTLKNCIVYNATGSTVNWKTNSVTTTATYSDFYSITSAPTGTGVITSDPLFVDAAAGNFRLRPTSPCLNTGVAV